VIATAGRRLFGGAVASRSRLRRIKQVIDGVSMAPAPPARDLVALQIRADLELRQLGRS